MHAWMKRTGALLVGATIALSMTAVAAADGPAAKKGPMRVAMISDGGTFNDQSFNQNCREGLEELMYAGAPLFVQFYEPLAEEQFAKQMAALAERNYRVVIGIGYGMSKALGQVARQYPETFFVGVDSTGIAPCENLQVLAFQVDECAFPAGYLAAAWADMKDPEDPAVAWVGGLNVDSVNQFVVGYVNGVKLYNERKGRNVRIVGGYAGSFTKPAAGGCLARKFLAGGADVVFAVAGATGQGALLAAKEAGKWAIGVDTDQYYTVPEAAEVLLTSCVKHMGRAVRDNVQGMLEGQFWGGTQYVGNLANHGVGLASFHDFDDEVSADVKRELLDIQRDLLSGQLSTGWAEVKAAADTASGN